MNCTTLASITIPGSSITSVGYSKFSGSGSFINCPQLKNIYINDLAAWCNIDFHTEDSNPLYFGGDLYLNGELITELVIPENISEIEGLAFYNCGSIEKVIIHNEVLSIGSNSFCGCDALKEAVILSGEIGSYSFYDCEALNNITIGGGVTSIGESAFAYCDALTNVYITDLSAWCKIDFNSHTSNPLIYGGKLYLNDHLVTELVIPNDVTAINPYTFYGCSNITKVTIPDHVTSIGKYAFSNCSALATVEIGNGVTKIGDAAFQYCNIKTFYCYASTPPSLTYNPYSPFKSDIEEEATLYVPARKGSVYKSSNWGDNFTNIVEMD